MRTAHYPYSTAPAPLPGPSSIARTGLAGLALCLALLAGGCGGGGNVRADRPPPTAQRPWATVEPNDPVAANTVLMRAIGLVGTPYRYGGNTPDSGFDCSGLVNYVFRDTLDVRLPRTSRELAAMQGPKIAPERLAPADLVFFAQGGEVSHVGIYVGEGRFVHAPRTGGTVRLDHLDGAYWRDHYSGAKRIIE